MPIMQTEARYPWPRPLDFSKQAFEVPGTRRAGQTGHYRNSAFPELLSVTSPSSPFSTVPELFQYALRTHPRSNPCFGRIPAAKPDHYEWETYDEVWSRIRTVGAGIQRLYEMGAVGPNETGLEVAGIWSINRPEWQILDFGLVSYSRVSVSLYDTLGPDSVEYIINHAQLPLVFTTANHISALLTLVSKCPSLNLIVSIDELDARALQLANEWAFEKGVRVMLLSEVESMGREFPSEMRLPTADDIMTISYTSGTTGNPKGVLLTHRNILAAVLANTIGSLLEQYVSFSYLPLAHIYGRVHELIVIAAAGAIGYSSGDLTRLLDECRMLKPDRFISVPRILNRINAVVKAQLESDGVAGALLRKGVEVKMRNLRATGAVTHPVWDALVFRKIKAILGGRVSVISCGSAPISGPVLDLLKVVFCCEVIQGYGMTENGGATTRCIGGDPTEAGSIGPPGPANEVKLVDVPEMGYLATDTPNSRGELCMRGENRFTGYYKDEENTKEAIDEEGWLHTGDVAEVDPLGLFKIIDRKKNIMKLSQGEYVALDRIEATYSTFPPVAQIYVHGDSLRDYLVAVVVPDPAQLAPLAGLDAKDPKALRDAIRDRKTAEKVVEALTAAARHRGLRGFERVKRVHLSLEPFTIDNGLLTSTMKLKRRDAYLKYKDELDALYDQPTLGQEKAKL